MGHLTTGDIAHALRHRAKELTGHGLDARDLFRAADELDRLNECSSDSDNDHDTILSLLRGFIGGRHSALETKVDQLKEIIMSLQPEVQALVTAVQANAEADVTVAAALTDLETQVVDLKAQLAAVISPGAPIDPEDLAAIVAATDTLNTSVAAVRAALPVPVPAPVVAAAVAAADAPTAGAT